MKATRWTFRARCGVRGAAVVCGTAVALVVMSGCGGGGSEATSSTTVPKATTTSEPGATARQFASVIAQNKEDILTLQAFRDGDCFYDEYNAGCPDLSMGSNDDPTENALGLTYVAARRTGEELRAVGDAGAEAQDLVDDTLADIDGFDAARMERSTCLAENDLDDEACMDELTVEVGWANRVMQGLTRWDPYL